MKLTTKAVWLVAVMAATSSTWAAETPDPTAIVLPTSVMTALLQHLQNEPYKDVAGLISNIQRCLQDQVPDAKGIIAERGGCPEIAKDLQQMKTPLPQTPPKSAKAP